MLVNIRMQSFLKILKKSTRVTHYMKTMSSCTHNKKVNISKSYLPQLVKVYLF